VPETIHRFGNLAVDELNGHRRAPREPKKDFAKLMIGLIGLFVLLYVLVVTWRRLRRPWHRSSTPLATAEAQTDQM